MNKFKTQSAYVSGAICGPIWWPVGRLCGRPFQGDIRGQLARYSDSSAATFRDVLLSMLCEHGGDFQGAEFTADSVIRVERVAQNGAMRTVHVWEREISALPDCADLVNAEAFSCDFF